MNAKRKAIWVGGLIGGLLFLLILALGPIWGPRNNQPRRRQPSSEQHHDKHE